MVLVQYETVELVPELRWSQAGLVGGGYKIVRDQFGNIQERTEWQSNGIVLKYDDYQPADKPWWKFWG